ncbi:hypothetical protein B0J18DRAFT_416387 [Chaetomium sp. MPI-SDFR-AT-0129]|nr:hypothetical protein B0J18DRAFT_416387 [Chaetomium sp. MPI-SDFR-AT-0129]
MSPCIKYGMIMPPIHFSLLRASHPIFNTRIMLEQSKDGDRSQAPTQEAGLEHLGQQAAPQKRPAPDDELEFISSNPVKKRKSTPTQTQPGPDSTPLTQHSPTSVSAPPPPLPAHTTLATSPARPPTLQVSSPQLQQEPPNTSTAAQIPSPTRLIDRCRSACGIRPAEIRKQVFVPEPRSGSLPTFDQFAFPRFSSPIRGPPTRLSVAISPKQLPYAVPTPQAPPDTGQSSGPRSFQPAVAPQTTIAFNQIPCLDYNGVPVTSRGFDMGQIFCEGGFLDGIGAGLKDAANPTPLPTQGPDTHDNVLPTANLGISTVASQSLQGTGTTLTSLPTITSSCPPQHQDGTAKSGTVLAGQTGQTGQLGYFPVVPRQYLQNFQPGKPTGVEADCPECARDRQQAILRQAQGLPLPNYFPSHFPINQSQQNRQQGNRNQSPAATETPHAPTAHPSSFPSGPSLSLPQSQPATGAETAQPIISHYQQQQHQVKYGLQPQMQQQKPALPILHHTTAYPAPVPTSQGLSPSSLLQDIAHTIRSGFPYAQVAARNGTPPEKVVETVGNLVITHLLRMASQSPRVR